jgi:hypothetical protein
VGTPPTPKDVADYMLRRLDEEKQLYQETIVYEIEHWCGDEYVYQNDRGNMAIKKSVLDEFRKLTGESVVWAKHSRYWRRREESDDPGRVQAYE